MSDRTTDYLSIMERTLRAWSAQPLLAPMASAAQITYTTTAVPAAAAATGSSAAPGEKSQRVLQFIAQNRNAGTSRAYEQGWKGFASYLRREGVGEDAITPWDVADYLRERVQVQGVAASTMGGDRAAIADRLKHTPLKHVVHDGVVADMMAVLRTQAAPSRPKQHVSAELMREMLLSHEKAAPSGRANAWLRERDLFLMLLMMMAFLREGEAVALTRKDVLLKKLRVDGKEKWVLHVYVARSKTDQAGEGHVVLLGANDDDPLCCPVRRFRRYAAVLDEHAHGTEAFFPKIDGGAMAAGTPCGIVQRAVREANDEAERQGCGQERWGDPDSYGSHSLRRGGVTTARANGVSMLDIQKHGRWKSLTVFSYVGTTAAEQLAVTNSFLAANRVETADDQIPSDHAHALRAAGAKAGRGVKRAAAALAAAALSVDERVEDELLEAACDQGWRESDDEEQSDGEERPKASRRQPGRGAKKNQAKDQNKKRKHK
jgi:integrase